MWFFVVVGFLVVGGRGLVVVCCISFLKIFLFIFVRGSAGDGGCGGCGSDDGGEPFSVINVLISVAELVRNINIFTG